MSQQLKNFVQFWRVG